MIHSSPQHFSSPRNAAFSLVEILAVLAVVSCLASISTFAFQNLTGSQTLGSGARDLSSLIELARTEAIARQTYVWVGVQNNQVSGSSQLSAAAVYSKDGTGNNATPSNLVPISKPIKIGSAQLVPRSELKLATQQLLTDPTASLSDNKTGIDFQVGDQTFSAVTLTMTPGGEVLMKGEVQPVDGYDARIDLSIRQAHGKEIAQNADDLALVIDGSNGAVKIVRLQ